MSSEETERVRLLSEAIKQQQKLEVVKVEADNAKKEILKGVGGTGDAEIQGISVPAPTAEELVEGVRSQSIETRIDGLFQILTVDTTSPDGFRVRLRNDESGEVFTAGLQDALLSESQKQAIQDAEWNKRLLKAKINARRIGRELTDAVVIDAEPVEAPRIGRSS